MLNVFGVNVTQQIGLSNLLTDEHNLYCVCIQRDGLHAQLQLAIMIGYFYPRSNGCKCKIFIFRSIMAPC